MKELGNPPEMVAPVIGTDGQDRTATSDGLRRAGNRLRFGAFNVHFDDGGTQLLSQNVVQCPALHLHTTAIRREFRIDRTLGSETHGTALSPQGIRHDFYLRRDLNRERRDTCSQGAQVGRIGFESADMAKVPVHFFDERFDAVTVEGAAVHQEFVR